MTRRALTVLVLALVTAGCIPRAPAPPPGRPAYIYGDSVVMQAQPYLKPGFTQRAQVGASPCGFYQSGQMQADAQTNPSVVILIFIGLYDGYWCEFGGNRYAAYLNDFRIIKSIFPNAKVYAALPPSTVSPSAPNGDVAQAAWDSGLLVLDARTILDDFDEYPRYTDGLHLLENGNRKLAEILSSYYKGASRS